MKQRKPYISRAFGVAVVLAAIIFSPPVFSLGCTVENLLPTQPEPFDVGEFDGNMTCGNWPTMAPSNCHLDLQKEGDEDSCQIETGLGTIIVTGEKVDGWISSESIAYDDTGEVVEGLGINKVILENARSANGCLHNSMYDVTSGEIAFVTKEDGDILETQPSGGAEFCADAIVSEVPPEPPLPEVVEPLRSCQVPGSTVDDPLGELDNTGIRCPTYTQEDYDTAEDDCDVNDINCPAFKVGEQKPVVVCNLEKDKEDWGTTDGSDVCCQCGIPVADQVACEVTDDPNDEKCEQSMTVNPTQSVELMFFKDDVDPCTWIKTSKGWKQWCY